MPGCISFLSAFLSSTCSAKENRMGTQVCRSKLPGTTHPALHGWVWGEMHLHLASSLGTKQSNRKALACFCVLLCFPFCCFLISELSTILCQLAIPWAYFEGCLINFDEGLLEPGLEFFHLYSEKMEDLP